MGAKEEIKEILANNPEGVSISDLSSQTGHTRATAAKYLELMKLQGEVELREVGKAKLWTISSKKKKILIAEDEANIRRLIQVILKGDGKEVILAEDGEEALEKVSSEMPDLIILDWMMPKIDGVDVCKQLKKNALTKKIPIIMLTAKKEMSDKVVGITSGAEDYLTKPFEPRELRERVNTFLQKGDRDRNPITNLPDFSSTKKKLASENSVLELNLENLEEYKKNYGYSRFNEILRLISQMVTHNLDNLSHKSFIGHSKNGGFLISIEENKIDYLLNSLNQEFESTLPFFYDIDYENIDLENNVITKSNDGKIVKIPLVKLTHKKLGSDEIKKLVKN